MAPEQHYGMPEEYKALTKTSKERLGFETFVPWNQVMDPTRRDTRHTLR